MCGRFTLKTPVANWLADLFPSWIGEVAPVLEPASVALSRARYNIAPTQQILVARCNDQKIPGFATMRWGLVPHWANSLTSSYTMINARSETIADKPSFRPSLIDKRCIVLADGYYEWKKTSAKSKEPYWIHTAGERVFAMAGLWAENGKIRDEAMRDEAMTAPPILSATIITTASNADVIDVHDRMPAIMFSEQEIAAWLDPSLNNPNSIERLLDQLRPIRSGQLRMRRVSSLVNSPANDLESLLDPATE